MPTPSTRIPTSAWIVAGSLLLAHLLTIERYGIFRDEFYYLANGRRLAWGYVDHPPLVGALAWLIEHTLGTSIVALRLPMLGVLVGVLAVMATMVRRLGGGGFAITLSWLAFAVSPYYLYTFHYLSMNAPEVLLWSLTAWSLWYATAGHVGAGAHGSAPGALRAWALVGLIIGLASLTKVSGVIWASALAAGLVMSPARAWLRTPGPWIAAGLGALLFAPHIAWQMAHGWPTAEFVRNAQADKIVALSPLAFLGEQVTLLGPVGAIVVVVGAAGIVRGSLRGGRVWAVAVAATLVVFLLQRSKAYYAMPAYPVLLAAGGVVIDRAMGTRPWRRRAVAALMLVVGLPLVPVTLPVLPPDRLPGYLAALGLEVSSGERHSQGRLPQHFADMFGWETLADDVARVVATLTPEERAAARIYTQNYGEAGALEYYGPSRGLPPVISGHNAYWFWGPGPDTPGPVVIVGGRAASHRQVFEDVVEGGRTTCTLCMPYEQNLPIFVCRRPRRPLHEIWPGTRHFG